MWRSWSGYERNAFPDRSNERARRRQIKKDIASAEPVMGDIIFSSAPSDLLKRTASTASLRHGAWPGDAPPIRSLLDARLTSMATLGFTLSGLEEVDGVLYAQSWYCREV
jgi:hypothetical protein